MEGTLGPMALRVSSAAASQAAALVGTAGKLRLFAIGGPGGIRYGLARTRRIDAGDFVVEAAGVAIVVDHGSAEWLAGSELDWVEDGDERGFAIRNPLGLHACGAPL